MKEQDKIDYFSIFERVKIVPTSVGQIKQLLQFILEANPPIVITPTNRDISKENWYIVQCQKKKIEQLEKVFSALQQVLEELRSELRESPSEHIRDSIKDGWLFSIKLLAGEEPFEFDRDEFCATDDTLKENILEKNS